MKIGYIRVSTQEQNESLQIDALKSVGCEKLFFDKGTGAKFDRKGLNEALAFMRPGDTLIVWKLDRLGRSLVNLIETLNILSDQDVGFVSLTENMDTTSPGGKLIFHIFGALAEFERALIQERTQAGLAAARARGKLGGRRPKLTKRKSAQLLKLYNDKDRDIAELCSIFKISRATLYKYITEAKNEEREDRSLPLGEIITESEDNM